MGHVIGIDLGTTYSAIAVLGEDGVPNILPNREGGRITPSVVYFQDDGSVLVGETAKRSAALNPLDTVEWIKRHMGNPDWRFEAPDGAVYTPEGVSALILKRLKEDAELYLGEGAVQDVVITVPAYFDDAKRRATRDAGSIAGMNVVRVLNEPTAAALAYGAQKGHEGTILVFDLGGGTFDVTVMSIREGLLDVLGTDGLHELGGKDWDDRVMIWLNREFQAAGGPDLMATFEDEAMLRERSETAKRTLSQTATTKVPLSAGGVTKTITLTRDTFEEITRDLLNQARDLTISLVAELGLGWGEIDRILLVGGSTRMPAVPQMIEQISGHKPRMDGNPDEMVALGAAIQASLEAPGASVVEPALVVKDVTSQGLGVIALDADSGAERNFVIIPRNTKIPAKRSSSFTTVVDGQTEINVRVTQGDDEDPAFVKLIGIQTIQIPPYPKGAPIGIEYAYDIDQIVFISVFDFVAQGLVASFEVTNDANLSNEDIHTATQQNRKTEVN